MQASQQTDKSSADVTNKEKEIGNSVAVGMTKSESQYSVHVPHEEQVPIIRTKHIHISDNIMETKHSTAIMINNL